MTDKLFICYASSDYYARETGISLIGFFENNFDYEPDEVFILDYGILEPNKEKLDGIATSYGKRITYLPAKQILERIQQSVGLKDFRGSLATYSRAFIDKIIPEYVNRLLYIDSDTVVVNSINGLKTFRMGSACLAGIETEVYSTMIKDGKLKLYSANDRYYGCGVVLFDLNNWRQRGCYDRMVDMLNIKRTYPCADQTLINNSLPQDYFCKLPRKYNYNTHIYGSRFERRLLTKGGWNSIEDIEDTINNPVVVHYPGNAIDRPWYKECTSRRKSDYFKYKLLSPWANDRLNDNPNNFGHSFSMFIHKLETNDKLYWLLLIINNVRGWLGKMLRNIGLLGALPLEGIE